MVDWQVPRTTLPQLRTLDASVTAHSTLVLSTEAARDGRIRRDAARTHDECSRSPRSTTGQVDVDRRVTDAFARLRERPEALRRAASGARIALGGVSDQPSEPSMQAAEPLLQSKA
jgi:hypothetical protein